MQKLTTEIKSNGWTIVRIHSKIVVIQTEQLCFERSLLFRIGRRRKNCSRTLQIHSPRSNHPQTLHARVPTLKSINNNRNLKGKINTSKNFITTCSTSKKASCVSWDSCRFAVPLIVSSGVQSTVATVMLPSTELTSSDRRVTSVRDCGASPAPTSMDFDASIVSRARRFSTDSRASIAGALCVLRSRNLYLSLSRCSSKRLGLKSV